MTGDPGRAEDRKPADVGVRSLATLLAIAGPVLVFGLLAELILEGDTAAFDRRILLWFRDPDLLSSLRGPAWLAEMLRDLTSLGSTVVLGILLALVLSFLALTRKWADCVLVVVSILGGQAIVTVLKLIFERARPDLVPGAPQVFTASFPSAHAMLSAVTYLTLGALLARLAASRALKIYFVGVALFLTLTVGLSRIMLAVHWPTDVLAGWCVGAAWAMACSVAAARLRSRGQLERIG